MRRAATKQLGVPAAAQAVAGWRAEGNRVVLANGVFDLLHVGHLRYLEEARRHGDRLVVAVNGDAASAGLEGAGQPVLPAAERAALVAALRCVDAVVVFEEPGADAILERLGPDVHAKGTDDSADTAPERATAAARGVRTVFAGDPQHSSRELVERVRARLRMDREPGRGTGR